MDWLSSLLANQATPGYLQPTPGPVPEWPSPTGPQTLGAALEPAPSAGASTPAAQANNAAESEPGALGFNSQGLVKSLQGVQAPKAPDVVKPNTPAVARPTQQIQTGQLLQFLQNLSQPQAARPTTLGGALGIGRY